jgi:hypothetical protein
MTHLFDWFRRDKRKQNRNFDTREKIIDERGREGETERSGGREW